MRLLRDIIAGWFEVFIVVLVLSAIAGVGKFILKRWRKGKNKDIVD